MSLSIPESAVLNNDITLRIKSFMISLFILQALLTNHPHRPRLALTVHKGARKTSNPSFIVVWQIHIHWSCLCNIVIKDFTICNYPWHDYSWYKFVSPYQTHPPPPPRFSIPMLKIHLWQSDWYFISMEYTITLFREELKSHNISLPLNQMKTIQST